MTDITRDNLNQNRKNKKFKTAVIVSLVAVILFVFGFVFSRNTGAYWVASNSVTGATLRSGSLDISNVSANNSFEKGHFNMNGTRVVTNTYTGLPSDIDFQPQDYLIIKKSVRVKMGANNSTGRLNCSIPTGVTDMGFSGASSQYSISRDKSSWVNNLTVSNISNESVIDVYVRAVYPSSSSSISGTGTLGVVYPSDAVTLNIPDVQCTLTQVR